MPKGQTVVAPLIHVGLEAPWNEPHIVTVIFTVAPPPAIVNRLSQLGLRKANHSLEDASYSVFQGEQSNPYDWGNNPYDWKNSVPESLTAVLVAAFPQAQAGQGRLKARTWVRDKGLPRIGAEGHTLFENRVSFSGPVCKWEAREGEGRVDLQFLLPIGDDVRGFLRDKSFCVEEAPRGFAESWSIADSYENRFHSNRALSRCRDSLAPGLSRSCYVNDSMGR